MNFLIQILDIMIIIYLKNNYVIDTNNELIKLELIIKTINIEIRLSRIISIHSNKFYYYFN